MRNYGIVSGLRRAMIALSEQKSRRIYGAANIAEAIKHTLKGKRYGNTSRYMPHQGERECARRRRAMGLGE